MSYEGFEQHICSSAHRFDCPAEHQFSVASLATCPICQGPSIFCNDVDDTNCDSYGKIDEEEWNLFLIREEKSAVCSLGHLHIEAPALYRCPSDEEKKVMRMSSFNRRNNPKSK